MNKFKRKVIKHNACIYNAAREINIDPTLNDIETNQNILLKIEKNNNLDISDTSLDLVDWNKVVSKKGETRKEHVLKHQHNNLNKRSHGVFYGSAVITINKAWKNRKTGYKVADGNVDLYIIPFGNVGYAGGYSGQGNNLNVITIVMLKDTNGIITGFPGFGIK